MHITNLAKNNKAFTLLEMLIVVVIWALMIWAFGYFMPNSNNQKEQIKFWIEAATDIYNHIKTSHNKIIRNHTEQFWSDIETIQYITINTTTNIATWIKIVETYNKNEAYQIEINLEHKNKKYKNTINKLGTKSIIIYNYDTFNENRTIETRACDVNLKNCIPTSQIEFNNAAQTILQKFCLELTPTQEKCLLWEK